MENLNKKNFWDEMSRLYPISVGKFCEWVDRYKEENDWAKLFQEHHNHMGLWQDAPKYHDLPIAMQIGIFVQWHQAVFLKASLPTIHESFKQGVIEILKLAEHYENTHVTGDQQVPGEEVSG